MHSIPINISLHIPGRPQACTTHSDNGSGSCLYAVGGGHGVDVVSVDTVQVQDFTMCTEDLQCTHKQTNTYA